MTKSKSKKKSAGKGQWALHSGLFEIYWHPLGYADRVRIEGTTFWYIAGKKTRGGAEEGRKKP